MTLILGGRSGLSAVGAEVQKRAVKVQRGGAERSQKYPQM